MAEPKEVPRRTRLYAVIAAAAFLFGALVNLVVVAEPGAEITPRRQDGATWQVGASSARAAGEHVWRLTIEPEGRRVVELDVDLPYSIRATHVAGRAVLSNNITYVADGREVALVTRTVVAEAPNATAPTGVSRSRTAIGDAGQAVSPVRVIIDGDPEVVEVVVRWTWSYADRPGTDALFTVSAHALRVRAEDAEGLPGCGIDCARVLFLLALLIQISMVTWWWGGPRPRDAPSLTSRLRPRGAGPGAARGVSDDRGAGRSFRPGRARGEDADAAAPTAKPEPASRAGAPPTTPRHDRP